MHLTCTPEDGFPSGGRIKNGHIRYRSYGGRQKKKKKELFRKRPVNPRGLPFTVTVNVQCWWFKAASTARAVTV